MREQVSSLYVAPFSKAGKATTAFAPCFGQDRIADLTGFKIKGGSDLIQFDSSIFADTVLPTPLAHTERV